MDPLIPEIFLIFPLIFSPFIILVSPQTLIHQEQTMENPLILQACSNIIDRGSCLANLKSFLDDHRAVHHKPDSILRAALKSTINETRLAMRTFTKFTSLSASSREQVAIADCKELLDFSVSELAWSLAEMKEIRASGSQNPDSQGNLKTWLSAALSNQDTCLEGFEGTDRKLERFIKGSLTQVTQLISNVLTLYTQLHALPFKPAPRNYGDETNSFFPKWMTEGDKDLMLARPAAMHVDAVVAVDGSGRYRSISEAINGAPNYSSRRYVIYVKRGVYKENVDMKKKKTNIMLVGDGIGATVVTGDRNFMQGWTTFRTSTVGMNILPIIKKTVYDG